MKERIVKQGISARILPENHDWLKRKARATERSVNWFLDNLVTEARKADEQMVGADNANKH